MEAAKEEKMEERVRRLEDRVVLIERGSEKSKIDLDIELDIELDTELVGFDDLLDDLPQDVFSFLFIGSTFGFAFNFGALIFLIQVAAIALILIDLLMDSQHINPLVVPSAVPWPTSISQVICLLMTGFMVSYNLVSSLLNIVNPAKAFFLIEDDGKKRRYLEVINWKWIVLNLLRLFQATLSLLVSFILIVQSDVVIELYFNFAGLVFIDELGAMIFILASDDFLLKGADDICQKVNQIKLCREKRRMTMLPGICPCNTFYRRNMILPIIHVALFFGWLYIFVQQRIGAYIPQSIRVQVSHNCNCVLFLPYLSLHIPKFGPHGFQCFF